MMVSRPLNHVLCFPPGCPSPPPWYFSPLCPHLISTWHKQTWLSWLLADMGELRVNTQTYFLAHHGPLIHWLMAVFSAIYLSRHPSLPSPSAPALPPFFLSSLFFSVCHSGVDKMLKQWQLQQRYYPVFTLTCPPHLILPLFLSFSSLFPLFSSTGALFFSLLARQTVNVHKDVLAAPSSLCTTTLHHANLWQPHHGAC